MLTLGSLIVEQASKIHLKRERKEPKEREKMLRNLDNLINMVIYKISDLESHFDFQNISDLNRLKLIQFVLMCEEAIEQSEIDSEP